MRMKNTSKIIFFFLGLMFSVFTKANTEDQTKHLSPTRRIPADIKAIFNKPEYKNSKWSLRVVDTETQQVLLDLNSRKMFYIGSVRKLFTIGEALSALGPEHRMITTVHVDGKVNHGNMNGNLVLVASGDLAMGGRTKPNGHIAISNYDHNDANTLGNAVLTRTNPLAGFRKLAKQIKKSGITKISGDVVIDDRLFVPFNYRDEFKVTAIFVNDDVVDVSIVPGIINHKAHMDWRPKSAAFSVLNDLKTVGPNMKFTLELKPSLPTCFGKYHCQGKVINQLPIDYIPPLTDEFPLVQTFRVTKPANYARTIFIEELQKAGVDTSELELIKENPVHLLKDKDFYNKKNQVASLISLPYGEYAKWILKVSYNIGADMSLMLFGLTKGVRNMADSLRVESEILAEQYDIPKSDYHFIDGSGELNTKAKNTAITKWLEIMMKSDAFPAFFNALPILGVDGSLAFVKNFESDPSLREAKGKVRAKTGTYIIMKKSELFLNGQALAGYITTKQNNKLVFSLSVNEVEVGSIKGVLNVFQDQGSIAAILWRDF